MGTIATMAAPLFLPPFPLFVAHVEVAVCHCMPPGDAVRLFHIRVNSWCHFAPQSSPIVLSRPLNVLSGPVASLHNYFPRALFASCVCPYGCVVLTSLVWELAERLLDVRRRTQTDAGGITL
ncbi:hypothetical protein BCV70DRAFT_51581 [Testicularia cyperi]|uniref:Secreted protein n=1 Tax=Testicularia cyperi TaxID=1882483 RepID=A0A317XUR9_9BASI|nr:hypothetical protein BCV70DRAFT_51581 [Testicularia cyperi]